MNSKTHEIVSAIITASIVLTSLNFATPAIAQRVSPRSALQLGDIVKSGMKKVAGGVVGGAATAVGTYGANQVLHRPVPQVFWQFVRMPNGQVYRVCQQVQNGYYGSPYYC